MKKILLVLCFAVFSIQAHAEKTNFWVELGLAQDGVTAHIKQRKGHQGWAYSYYNFQNPTEMFIASYDYVARNTMEPVQADFHVLGISRFTSASFGWGYADVGVGLGIGKGDWLENCDRSSSFVFHTTYECDLKDGSRLGIPIHASAVLGRYAGIGVSFNMFVSLDFEPQYQLALTIPLGNFTK